MKPGEQNAASLVKADIIAAAEVAKAWGWDEAHRRLIEAARAIPVINAT